MKKLSIIIPVYNEREYIKRVIYNLKKIKLNDIKKEIIIVDDGSTDGTASILNNYKNDRTIKLIFSKKNAGKGVSIRKGLKYATGSIIIFQDADLECDIKDYPELLKPILQKKADVVFGSRFLRKNIKISFLCYLGNKILSLMATILFFRSVSDEATVYKVFKSKIIKKIKLKSKRFELCPEITAKVLKNRNIRFIEVPIKYNPRSISQGKKLRLIEDGIIAAWTLLKYRFTN